MTAPSSPPAFLTCTCCGRAILDTAAENVWDGEVPYPGDLGTGLCRGCGGDPDAEDPRERLGFAVTAFVDARIPIVAARLSPKNCGHFLVLPYEEQVRMVLTLVARGLLA